MFSQADDLLFLTRRTLGLLKRPALGTWPVKVLIDALASDMASSDSEMESDTESDYKCELKGVLFEWRMPSRRETTENFSRGFR